MILCLRPTVTNAARCLDANCSQWWWWLEASNKGTRCDYNLVQPLHLVCIQIGCADNGSSFSCIYSLVSCATPSPTTVSIPMCYQSLPILLRLICCFGEDKCLLMLEFGIRSIQASIVKLRLQLEFIFSCIYGFKEKRKNILHNNSFRKYYFPFLYFFLIRSACMQDFLIELWDACLAF